MIQTDCSPSQSEGPQIRREARAMRFTARYDQAKSELQCEGNPEWYPYLATILPWVTNLLSKVVHGLNSACVAWPSCRDLPLLRVPNPRPAGRFSGAIPMEKRYCRKERRAASEANRPSGWVRSRGSLGETRTTELPLRIPSDVFVFPAGTVIQLLASARCAHLLGPKVDSG